MSCDGGIVSDAPSHHHSESGGNDADAVIQEAARLVALEQNVSATAALRLIRYKGFESGRFIGHIAQDITDGQRIIDDRSP
jgi:hypothetical protein